ncbi:glycosyltransferase family 1 protein [Pradoshia sp. D12]|uniref:glycosyltransferase n=1 Tax=Bacillaceae TaxID=186817 RepID=UPI0011274747|nr:MULTISPECIES: glycosyltransferase [Bacillaceae]QFK72924.1 glycosyltransferase family 1 protein [Pradoshia sp. D12]TPF71916.1 glycosyltransferase family 1 protein [Bacillus sp. D12]
MEGEKRILVVVDSLNSGGIASVVLNIAKGIYTRGFKCDFICYMQPTEEVIEELKAIESRYFVINRLFNSNPLKYIKSIKEVIRKNGPYLAIHVHTAMFIWLACLAAKTEGINVRVGHAHGSSFDGSANRLTRLLQPIFKVFNRLLCTKTLTCADKSGRATFGKAYEFIPNFINLNKIDNCSTFDKADLINSFGIPKDGKILGYVGYIGGEKNTKHLVNLFNDLKKDDIKAYLVIIGDGREFISIKESFRKCGLSDYVCMLGYKTNAMELMRMFDVYLVPSFSEGMSMSLLEAQINGVPSIVSPGVPLNNDIGAGLFYRCNTFKVEEWTDEIKKVLDKQITVSKDKILLSLKNKEYDMDSVCSKYVKVYQDEK